MDKLVSIIIPVYNTPSDYLTSCFVSVRAQDYPALEVVVVDDGSDAETALFLERECGGEFRLFHKENGGLSDARNFGIRKSTGSYIYLLDSDDALSFCGVISTFVENAERTGADLVVGAYHYVGIKNGPRDAMGGVDWLISSLKSGISFSAADQLYSRNLLDRLDRLFRVGLVHEDEEFTPRALIESRVVAGLPHVTTYARSNREGSITKSMTAQSCFKRCEGKLIVARDSLKDSRYSIDSTLRHLMDERAFSFANMAFRSWATNLDGTDYERVLFELASKIDYTRARFSLRDARSLRNWLCISFLRLFGLKNYLSLIRSLCR